MELIRFPVCGVKLNIAEKIGANYFDFGVLLLEDEDGDQITAIEKEHRGNAMEINRQILRMWLKGKGRRPVTWATLVSVLKDVGLVKLAEDITAVKLS